MAKQQEKDIDQLNSFLKGERSAVETYRQCIDKMDDPIISAQLEGLCASHEQRVVLLSDKISSMGGEPASSSGVWGSFAKLVEGGASLFGKSAAISTLEEGEDHGKNDYAKDLERLSPEVRQFIQMRILPEQHRTHDSLRALQERV